MEYVTHQRRLLPGLASTYAMHLAMLKLKVKPCLDLKSVARLGILSKVASSYAQHLSMFKLKGCHPLLPALASAYAMRWGQPPADHEKPQSSFVWLPLPLSLSSQHTTAYATLCPAGDGGAEGPQGRQGNPHPVQRHQGCSHLGAG